MLTLHLKASREGYGADDACQRVTPGLTVQSGFVSEDKPGAESIPVRRETVDVGVLFELTTEVMQRQARTLGIPLTVRIDDDVPSTVRLDRHKVAWAMTSLVGSA